MKRSIALSIALGMGASLFPASPSQLPRVDTPRDHEELCFLGPNGETLQAPDLQRREKPFDIGAARGHYEEAYLRVRDERSQSEFAPITLPALPVGPTYSEQTHRNFTEIAARYWGLPTTRIQNMQSAADQPDANQSGFSNYYNQQWSHAYILASHNIWIWGDADEDFHDNLDGYAGGLEGPEGYNGKSAKEFYQAGDQVTGDWYVGYATHYMADASLIVHASAPSIRRFDLLTKHFALEDWILNNANAGHKLLATVAADPYYYPVTEPKTSLRNAAYFVCYWSNGVGKRVWDAYVASGYPTAAGSGSAELVAAAKEMMIRTGRYVKGAVKYALDANGQWTSSY